MNGQISIKYKITLSAYTVLTLVALSHRKSKPVSKTLTHQTLMSETFTDQTLCLTRYTDTHARALTRFYSLSKLDFCPSVPWHVWQYVSVACGMSGRGQRCKVPAESDETTTEKDMKAYTRKNVNAWVKYSVADACYWIKEELRQVVLLRYQNPSVDCRNWTSSHWKVLTLKLETGACKK